MDGSTTNFRSFRFGAHGDHRAQKVGNIVHCYLDNEFNLEGIKDCFMTVKTAVAELKQWILFIHTTPSTIAKPDAENYSLKHLPNADMLGCIGIAFHTANSILRYFAEKLAKQVRCPFVASPELETLNISINSVLSTYRFQGT